jgi:hypothetical protein
MSAAIEIHSCAPSVPDAVEGDGWVAALCLSWAQIVEGGAVCAYCPKPATVAVATGADPEYVPICWKCATGLIASASSFGDYAFGSFT